MPRAALVKAAMASSMPNAGHAGNAMATTLSNASIEPQDQGMETGAVEADAMRMSIDGCDVTVAWEDNQAVRDLRELVDGAPLTVRLSMYGGFEQVGRLGTRLTSSDVRTTTRPGDIVLYAGNQIVVFYGSNSWAYTRLGHITSHSAKGMADLLGNGDVSITITSGEEQR